MFSLYWKSKQTVVRVLCSCLFLNIGIVNAQNQTEDKSLSHENGSLLCGVVLGTSAVFFTILSVGVFRARITTFLLRKWATLGFRLDETGVARDLVTSPLDPQTSLLDLTAGGSVEQVSSSASFGTSPAVPTLRARGPKKRVHFPVDLPEPASALPRRRERLIGGIGQLHSADARGLGFATETEAMLATGAIDMRMHEYLQDPAEVLRVRQGELQIARSSLMGHFYGEGAPDPQVREVSLISYWEAQLALDHAERNARRLERP